MGCCRSIPALLVLLLFAGKANAQQPFFTNYTMNDGLVANNIRQIFQDAKGFLWIATWEGLSKYDGYRFTAYSTANGLAHNMVNDFYEQKDGKLYVALNNGSIDKICGNTVSPVVPSSDTVINCFVRHRGGAVFVSTDRHGIQRFQNEGLSAPKQAFPASTFTEMIWANDSVLLALGNTTLLAFDPSLRLIAELNEKDLIYHHSFLYQDTKKQVWIGTAKGLRLLKEGPQKGQPLTVLMPPPQTRIPVLQQAGVLHMLEQSDGTRWFATYSGLVKMSPDGKQQIFTRRDGLPANNITRIFQDREQNLWFGTTAGISKLTTQQPIRLYPVANGLYQNDYSFILHPLSQGKILAGTSAGVRIFDKHTGTFASILPHDKQIFYTVVPHQQSLLLLGVDTMAVLDTASLKYIRQRTPWLYGYSKTISDGQGNFFTGGVSSLYFTAGTQRIKLLDYRISSLLLDRSGSVWVGTWLNGVFRLKYRFINKRFVVEQWKHFLPDGDIRSLYEDREGNIWVGTRYEGLYHLQKKSADSFTVSNYNQQNGLTSNFIKAVREDPSGNYWVAFYQGLDKLIATEKGFRVFNFSRINNYFTSVIGMETDADHALWLATTEGLVHIEDGKLEKAPPLPVYITNVFSQDSVYGSSKPIQLGYQQNQLRFEFSAPGFINEKQLLYSYRLSGNAEGEWTKAAAQHSVSYASLSPGDYLFEVRSLGWNGAWGQATAFAFSISPPFWQTGWFISFSALLLLAIVYGFTRWREKNIQTIALQKLKVEQLAADQLKSKLELELIINYFSSSLIGKNTKDAVLWDVAKNLIGRLGFADCMIYLWNEDKTKMVQKAGFGPKGSLEEIQRQPFDVAPGQGVVGYVMQTKEAVRIPDTSVDKRYRADEMTRLSEITVPVVYNDELIAVIDSEHPQKGFFGPEHLQLLTTIATLMANKLNAVEKEQSLQQTQLAMHSINEQLADARLEALRSQMNPHFIFNCINSIDALIHSNDKYGATTYLNKFAKLLRNILDSSKKNEVLIADDIETLKLYVELEELRNENKFGAVFTVDKDVTESDYKVPALIVQPFVENAILHGLQNREGDGGLLRVDIKKQHETIQYTIADNGIGRAAAGKINQGNQSHYGLPITSDRIRLFNGTDTAAVQINDLYADGVASGTEVIVHLKIR